MLTPLVWTDEDKAGIAHRKEMRELLETNYAGPIRALQASLNEFRHWTLEEVAAQFRDYPPLQDRRLYPLGPESLYPPQGGRRFVEFAGKIAALGVLNTLTVAASPLTIPWLSNEERRKAASKLIDLNKQAVSSSFFVAANLDLMEKAGRRNEALCVNKLGQFRILRSSYAAISHVWAETMGLQFNGEKIEQDDRGLQKMHFNKIMSKALQCGYEWVWFDLLAIPKMSNSGSSNARSTQVKLLVINSLESVYRNADAVIVLDSFALNLSSGDPLRVAAALVCGMWLTRIWTYQEAKLAKQALVVTTTSVVSFTDIFSAVEQQAQLEPEKWSQLHNTFDRLQPLSKYGINLADIALSSTNRNTENDIDFARGFYALLGLQWQSNWTYEDGIQHIYRSRPQEVAMLASMHSLRGLPQPFSWAPRYLAQQQGVSQEPYFFKFNGSGLIGPWYTATVRELAHTAFYGEAGAEGEENHKLALQLQIEDESGTPTLVSVVTWDVRWTPKLITWVELIPTGSARIICPRSMSSHNAHKAGGFLSVLLAIQRPAAGAAQAEGASGDVLASAILVGGSITTPQVQWLLV
ncbi:hypothetical protein LTR27_001349 [Elasticomyces elasticus]|nr:hypothetical protein LTR27_001349 [Elasticomyces elasticus]